MIASDGFLVKWRQNQLALLFMLRTIHPRETKANSALRGIWRTVNELAGSAKFCRVAQNLPIKFRTDCEDVQLCGLAKGDRAERYQAPAFLMQLAHASNRVAKKMDVFAGGKSAGQDILLHQEVLAPRCQRGDLHDFTAKFENA